MILGLHVVQCFINGFWVCSITSENGYTACSSPQKCVALEEAKRSLAKILAVGICGAFTTKRGLNSIIP